MTDKVNISPGQTNHARPTARSFRHGAGDYVVPTDGKLTAQYYTDMNTPPYDAFDHVGTTGLDVTIGSGEAIVTGAAVARDTNTVVSLDDNTAGQTVYVSWSYNSTSSITIGPRSSYPSGNYDLALWTFDTENGSVVNVVDERPIGQANAQSDMFYSRNEADNRFLEVSGDGLTNDLDFAGNAALSMAFDTGESRPSDPSIGQAVLRTDKDPWQLEVWTTRGWKVRTFVSEHLQVADFEDQTGDGWIFDGSGTTGFTTKSTEGSYSLRTMDVTRNVAHPTLSGDGGALDHYIQRGDEFRVLFQVEDYSGQFRFLFGRDHTDPYSTEEHYRVVFNSSGGGIAIDERDSAGSTEIGFTSTNPIATGDWIEMVVRWDHPDASEEIDVEITNTATGSSVNFGATGSLGLNHEGIELYTNDLAAVVWDTIEVLERTA